MIIYLSVIIRNSKNTPCQPRIPSKVEKASLTVDWAISVLFKLQKERFKKQVKFRKMVIETSQW